MFAAIEYLVSYFRLQFDVKWYLTPPGNELPGGVKFNKLRNFLVPWL
jgi:hypothetical protein